MADPYVREVGRLQDMDGIPIVLGVDYDTVTIQATDLPVQLSQGQAEEFAQLFVSACWQAGQQKRRMDEEVHEADGGDTQEHVRFPLSVRYAYPDSGWEADREEAAKNLTVGRVYGIHSLEVGQSTSYFTFREVAGKYNTVLFEPVDDDAP